MTKSISVTRTGRVKSAVPNCLIVDNPRTRLKASPTQAVFFHSFANRKEDITLPVPGYATVDTLIKLLRKTKKLASKGIDIRYDPPVAGNAMSDRGRVFAGDRHVASFTIIKLNK